MERDQTKKKKERKLLCVSKVGGKVLRIAPGIVIGWECRSMNSVIWLEKVGRKSLFKKIEGDAFIMGFFFQILG